MKLLIDNYKNITIKTACHTKYEFIHLICRRCTNLEILKYAIDNCIDLECETSKKWRPIHYICRYSINEIIKYIIDKGVSLECETNNKSRPIYIIRQRFTYNIM
jgi:hypothetical protein